MYQVQESISVREDVEKSNRSMTNENRLTFCVINVIIVITVIIVIKCMSRLRQRTFKVQALTGQTTLHGKNKQRHFLQRNRCPHHPHAQLVRFDPAGQAWCDKLDCWDCFRLMKIGEALEYRCLTDLVGRW